MATEVLMPRLGANDNYVNIAQWLVNDGDYVEKDSMLAVLETTKETSDLLAPVSGYLRKASVEGKEYEVNKRIAYIVESKDELIDDREASFDNAFGDYKITKKAEKYAKERNIDITGFDKNMLITERMLQDFFVDTKAPADGESINCEVTNSVIMLCGGELCKMSICAIRSSGVLNIYGILDDKLEKGQEVMGVRVLGDVSELKGLYDKGFRYVVNTLGAITPTNENPFFHRRKELYLNAKPMGFIFPNVMHSTAFVDPSVRLGEGNLIFAKALIDCDTLIGNNTIINTGSIISHDCRIEDHVRISPGAILAGGVTIGENSLIGMGVTVYMNVRIGKNVVISNGKNIFTNIPDNAMVV